METEWRLIFSFLSAEARRFRREFPTRVSVYQYSKKRRKDRERWSLHDGSHLLSLVEVPAGSFMMGALSIDEHAADNETPRHKVTLTKSLLVSKYACTQDLYEAVMGKNPSRFKRERRPVEQVFGVMRCCFVTN